MKERIQKLKTWVKNHDMELYTTGLIVGSLVATIPLVKCAAKQQAQYINQQNGAMGPMVDMFATALQSGAEITLKPNGGYSIDRPSKS